MNKVRCWKCYKSFEIDTDEYWETEQEETINIVICPHCNAPNSITWANTVYFGTHEPDEKDKENFKYFFEDNQVLIEQSELNSGEEQ